MSPLKKIVGLGLALMLDIGSGIIITRLLFVTLTLDVHWYDYSLGAFFSMLPDLDVLAPIVKELLGGSKGDSSHKALPTHYPLVMMPVAGLALLCMAPSHYALLTVICLFMHFVHDSWQSQEKGPGVRWLAPFGRRYYQILSRHSANGRFHLFLTVSPKRVQETFKETLEEWLNSRFFCFTLENLIGVATFIIGVLIILS